MLPLHFLVRLLLFFPRPRMSVGKCLQLQNLLKLLLKSELIKNGLFFCSPLRCSPKSSKNFCSWINFWSIPKYFLQNFNSISSRLVRVRDFKSKGTRFDPRLRSKIFFFQSLLFAPNINIYDKNHSIILWAYLNFDLNDLYHKC